LITFIVIAIPINIFFGSIKLIFQLSTETQFKLQTVLNVVQKLKGFLILRCF